MRNGVYKRDDVLDISYFEQRPCTFREQTGVGDFVNRRWWAANAEPGEEVPVKPERSEENFCETVYTHVLTEEAYGCRDAILGRGE